VDEDRGDLGFGWIVHAAGAVMTNRWLARAWNS